MELKITGLNRQTEVKFWCRGPLGSYPYRSLEDHDAVHAGLPCTVVRVMTVTITLEESVSRETSPA